MTALGAIKLFSLAASAISTGMDVLSVLNKTNGILSKMIEEGRDPTDAELEYAFSRVAALNEEIQDTE